MDDITIHMDKNDMVSYPRKENVLEHKIRELINKITNSIYTSSIKVIYDDGMYLLKLGLNCRDATPISLCYQGTEDEFLNFVENELKKRRLQEVEYTNGILINEDNKIYYPVIEL